MHEAERKRHTPWEVPVEADLTGIETSVLSELWHKGTLGIVSLVALALFAIHIIPQS